MSRGLDTCMLHPQTRAMLDRMEAGGAPPAHLLAPAAARTAYRERGLLLQPPASEVMQSLQMTMEGPAGRIALRVYRPAGVQAGQRLAALIYYHGGGWVVGDLDTHDTLCRALANGSGCAVFAVDYRLAPEHRFPAAMEDAYAALTWVARNADALWIDAARIAVGGDSVGGNLAGVVALTARDCGGPALQFQLLIYPATDLRRLAPSHRAFGQGYLLTSEMLAHCYAQYLGDEAQMFSWKASPLLHDDLSGLPSAFILTAGFDPLRDEGMQYAQRLSAAGNRAALVCFERQVHGFITMGKAIDEAQVAVQLCASQLQVALAPR